MKFLQRSIILLYKIFFIGLLLQFFLHTWITFGFGFDAEWMTYIWLWKEGVIGLLGLISLVGIIASIKGGGRKRHFFNKDHNIFLLILLLTVAVCAVMHFYFVGGSLGAFAMAFKYDFLGFFILLVAVHSSTLLTHEQRHGIIAWYGKVMKYCLLLSLIWYFVIFIKPGTLKLFGYNNFVYEGLVGNSPPAVYYTHINRGIPRNQFLFERPITRGFFLTAMWPIFYMLFLHKKPLKDTRLRWVFYGLNIILTFSRAAWGTWIIEIILMMFILSRNWKRTLIRYGLPIIGVFLLISILGFEQIMNRGYSNFGHITMVKNGRAMFMESPLRGSGGATAGPGSHRGGIPFNPENQFLQIMIEFGLIGFVGWLLLFCSLCLVGIKKRYKTRLPLIQEGLLLGCSLGMIGLAISGMVLHSFSDRMVVYPFMMLFGCIIAYSYLPLKK